MSFLTVIVDPRFDELSGHRASSEHRLLHEILVSADGAVVPLHGQSSDMSSRPVPEVASGPCGFGAEVAVSVWLDEDQLSKDGAQELLMEISRVIATCDAYRQFVAPPKIHLQVFSPTFAIERVMPEA